MRRGQNRRGRDRNPEYYEPQNDAGAWNEADPNAWDDQYQEAYEDSYAWGEAGSDTWDSQDQQSYENADTWGDADPGGWDSEDPGRGDAFPVEEDGLEFVELDDGWESADEQRIDSRAAAHSKQTRRTAANHGQERRPRGSSPEKRVKIQHMIILIGLIVVFVVSGSFFIADLHEYKTAENEYEKITEATIKLPDSSEKAATVEVDGEEIEIPLDEFPDLVIDFDALKATNEDFVGVLYVPALELTYPVAHSRDNSEYLSRTFEGTRNASGCIFMDMYAKEDFSDSNTFIFGHNMKNQTMFGSLKRFSSDKGLCDSHPYVYFFTKEKVYKYRIFSYFPTPVDSYIYNGFTGQEGYDEYVRKSQRDSQYKEADLSEIDFTQYPNLLTLSTCFGTQHTHNFVVQSALVATLDLTEAGNASEPSIRLP
ncbi:MAG: class B sortase [Lachnospiraceae bacterium]|nr:class B sortase [Lachnospiraceae bacterium]